MTFSLTENRVSTVIMVLGALPAVLLLLSGCSSDPTLKYISAVEGGQQFETSALYKDEIAGKGRNLELYLMEKGRIAQICGDFEGSRESFNSQIDILRQREISDDTTQGAQINVGSVAVNDNMLPYKARLFEVEMLRLFQAYNYLAKGSLEGALIEVRNAEFLMNEAEKARRDEKFNEADVGSFESRIAQKSVQDAKAESPKTENPPPDPAPEKKQEQPPKPAGQNEPAGEQAPPPTTERSPDAPPLDAAGSDGQPAEKSAAPPQPQEPEKTAEEKAAEEATRKGAEEAYAKYFDPEVLAKTKSSFLNPYVIYMGALAHEMGGELNDAYISYKKSLQLMPSNPYVQRDTIRLARRLGQDQDFDWLKTTFPQAWEADEKNKPDPALGRLVVIYEDGWAPRKEEVFISMAAVAVAYPVYRFKWSDPSPLAVSAGTEEGLKTYPICYMNALALRALEEEAKWRIIRQTARVLVKGSVFATGATMTAASSNGYVQAAGIAIMVASAIYNNLSEKADLRCWMTLPDNVQILVADLPEGKTDLKFSSNTMTELAQAQVQITKGKTCIVRVVRVGPRVIVQNLWPASAKAE